VARTYMDEHRFRDAINACRAIGTGALGHACIANAHMIWRRATEALPEVELALKEDPTLYEARVAEAGARWLEGSMGDAERILIGIIAAEPKRLEGRLLLGDLYAAQGKREQALEAYKAARATDPDDPDAAYAVGNLVASPAEAAEALEAAVAGRPSFGAAWARLAEIRVAQGRLAEAEKASLTAIKLDPKQADWHVGLARIYQSQKRIKEGLNEARAALKIVGNSAAAKLVEADLLAEQGELDPALEAYQAAFGLDRMNPRPLVHASGACLAAGRETSAKAFAERATQQFPKFGPGWVALGDVHAKGKEPTDARKAYETALGREGTDAEEVRRKIAALH